MTHSTTKAAEAGAPATAAATITTAAERALEATRVGFGFDLVAPLDKAQLIVALHAMIERGDLASEIPIDVANYAHVPEGASVLLVCHRGQLVYGLDRGRPTLRYLVTRPSDPDAPFVERARAALATLVSAAARLRDEPAVAARVDSKTLRFTVRDRLLAPPSAATRAVVSEALSPLLSALQLGASQPRALQPGAPAPDAATEDPRAGLELVLRFADAAVTLERLSQRLSST